LSKARTTAVARRFEKPQEIAMVQRMPIHDLRANLEARRLKSIEELAKNRNSLPGEAMREIAMLQTVLTAVREEIASHEVRLGGGAESPLK
jgi:hypothetical protein